jgi:hypothetical protein
MVNVCYRMVTPEVTGATRTMPSPEHATMPGSAAVPRARGAASRAN